LEKYYKQQLYDAENRIFNSYAEQNCYTKNTFTFRDCKTNQNLVFRCKTLFISNHKWWALLCAEEIANSLLRSVTVCLNIQPNVTTSDFDSNLLLFYTLLH